MSGESNVIVTDGFTGNIALKTAEGTAKFINTNLKKSLSKLSLIFSYFSLKKFKDKLDKLNKKTEDEVPFESSGDVSNTEHLNIEEARDILVGLREDYRREFKDIPREEVWN